MRRGPCWAEAGNTANGSTGPESRRNPDMKVSKIAWAMVFATAAGSLIFLA